MNSTTQHTSQTDVIEKRYSFPSVRSFQNEFVAKYTPAGTETPTKAEFMVKIEKYQSAIQDLADSSRTLQSDLTACTKSLQAIGLDAADCQTQILQLAALNGQDPIPPDAVRSSEQAIRDLHSDLDSLFEKTRECVGQLYFSQQSDGVGTRCLKEKAHVEFRPIDFQRLSLDGRAFTGSIPACRNNYIRLIDLTAGLQSEITACAQMSGDISAVATGVLSRFEKLVDIFEKDDTPDLVVESSGCTMLSLVCESAPLVNKSGSCVNRLDSAIESKYLVLGARTSRVTSDGA